MRISSFVLTSSLLLKHVYSLIHSIFLIKFINIRIMQPNFCLVFSFGNFIFTSNPPTELENMCENNRFFIKNYIRSAISFYFLYNYFYCCDNKKIETKRIESVKEKYINQQIRPELSLFNQQVETFDASGVKICKDMTCKELKNRFLTKFPNYDLMMFKKIFFGKADSLIPVLNELKNEIARFVLNEISNDDSIIVNCLVKFFTETEGIAPERLSSNSCKDDMNLGIVSSDYSGLLYKNLDKLISNNILKWYKSETFRTLFANIIFNFING
ncbi:hypothetical protein CWI38_1301p0010 [Hamiltosporidium tvaerminnensis]|uniref:Uncharacterized protein n=1 Tax=Hamiltosporidium tvaerminnensis TaxID=1176355 RepID=A0A4Q9LUJ7_9MICR|nr:hypothetical protein CWI38_1301p0010 [Hamiltosporidium tvaerminnensis]